MIRLRHLTILAAAGLTTMVVAGCGANDVDVDIDDGITPQHFGSAKPACPAAHAPKPASWYQLQATRVAYHVMGGGDAFADNPYIKNDPNAANLGNPMCQSAKVCIDLLRNAVTLKNATIEVTDIENGTVCGLASAIYTLTLKEGSFSPEHLDTLANCAGKLDGCWGQGVSGFFYPTEAYGKRQFKIDPSAAATTVALNGSTGATAAAKYVNSGAATQVVRWVSTWRAANSFGFPAAGMPCSLDNMPQGATTNYVIVSQPATNSRKCVVDPNPT